MNKTSLFAIFVLTTTLAATVHAADFQSLNPYVGAGYSYADAGYKGNFDTLAETKHHAGFIAAGIRPNRYWGAETFYQLSAHADKSALNHLVKTETSFQAFGLDALGYLPVHDKVDLIGSAGVGYYRFKADYSRFVSGSDTENNFGWRLGIGAQYHVTDNLSLRGMVRYVDINDSGNDAVDDLTDISIGVYYHF